MRQKLDYLGDEEAEMAPERLLPQSSFFSIEYPAILNNRKDENPIHPDEHPALTNALSSLAPRPAPYANPISALRHIARLAEKPGRAPLECRLGQACMAAASASTSSKGNLPNNTPVSNNEVYRHAILGEVSDAHNIVLKVTKRVWRRKQRTGHTLQQNGEGSSNERREYTAVALGITRKVARFRSLADFQYDPGYVDSTNTTNGQEEATRQSLSLYDSLAQMDIDSLRNVVLNKEMEDYELDKDVPGKGRIRVSNIRLPPAQLFDKVDVPFIYGFHQNPTSSLLEYGREDSDGKKSLRYMNKLKFANMAPIQFSLSSRIDKAVPVRPRDVVLESRKVNEDMYRQLKELFDKQPVWTRLKLCNQFPAEERKNVFNQKQCLAACCYTITDGCMRDCLIRHGYDPRKNKESRFYQKLSFQKNPRSRTSRLASSTVEPEIVAPPSNQDLDILAEDETDDGESHIFDGITPVRVRGNYLLMDVEDELVRPLINQQGSGVLRTDKMDITTGWYTEKHFEKIRSVMSFRYHHLLEEGVPASREDCDAIIAQIDNPGMSKPVKATSQRSQRLGSMASTTASQV